MSREIRINPDVSNIPYGDRKRILDAAQKCKDLADLASGNPDMPIPQFIRDRLQEGLDRGYARYTNYYGMPELRQKLADRLAAECGIVADPEKEVLVTVGVQEALYVAMRVLLQPGDEVLIPSPHYANYYMNTVACGAKPILVPLDQDSGFLPDIDRLEKAITPRTRALVFCNPSNPLGVVWPRQTMEAFSDLAQARDLSVLVDEIYRDFTYTTRPPSIASLPGMKERTFTFGGFSKSYMMMGLRVGYVIGPAGPMFHVRNLHYCIALCPPSLGQLAALAALDCPREDLETLHRDFRDRLQFLYENVSRIPGVTCVKPQGAFYLFPNMKRFGLSSMDLAIQLVEKAGVTTLPGTEFGPYGEGYLRLSVCAKREQLEKGVARLLGYAAGFR
jgi:aminotransferase